MGKCPNEVILVVLVAGVLTQQAKASKVPPEDGLPEGFLSSAPSNFEHLTILFQETEVRIVGRYRSEKGFSPPFAACGHYDL